MRFELEPYNRNVPDDELLADLRAVADKLATSRVTIDQYNANGRFHHTTLFRRFGTWLKALQRAGLEQTRSLHISEEEWFSNLEQVWETLGHQPRYDDMRKPISKYSSAGYAARFGSWRRALEAFIKFVEANGMNEGEPLLSAPSSIKRTPRHPSWRLRFLVLRRDNFSCQACGASPAKSPAVTLHVDHIRAWSDGGETVFENLHTLCEPCNIGRSNLPLVAHSPATEGQQVREILDEIRQNPILPSSGTPDSVELLREDRNR